MRPISKEATRNIELRPATSNDFEFALNLYLVTMRNPTAELMEWDENRQFVSFAQQWKLDDVKIIYFEAKKLAGYKHWRLLRRYFFNNSSLAPLINAMGSGQRF